MKLNPFISAGQFESYYSGKHYSSINVAFWQSRYFLSLWGGTRNQIFQCEKWPTFGKNIAVFRK